MMIGEKLYDFRYNELSLKRLKKKENIAIIEKPLLRFIIPIGLFYMLYVFILINMRLGIYEIYHSLFFVINALGLLYIGWFIKYAKERDLGYKYVIQGKKRYLLFEYRRIEIVNFLKNNRYISGKVSEDDLFYDMLIQLFESTALNSSHSWGATSAIIGILGIVFSLYFNGCLMNISCPEIVVSLLSLITIIFVFGFIRRIYYEYIDSRKFKFMQLSIELQNIKIASHKR
jgi:hypothetical protein